MELQTLEPPSEKAATRAEIQRAMARTGWAQPQPAPDPAAVEAVPTLAELEAMQRALGRRKDELNELRTVRGLMRRLGPSLRRIRAAGAR